MAEGDFSSEDALAFLREWSTEPLRHNGVMIRALVEWIEEQIETKTTCDEIVMFLAAQNGELQRRVAHVEVAQRRVAELETALEHVASIAREHAAG